MKTCNKCKIEKPDSDYYTVNKRKRPTLYHICKPCCVIKAQEYKEYYRGWELQKNYGISLTDYQQEVEKRNSCCDICGKQKKTLHVDHCHDTGAIRGFLCGSCNRGLGLLQEDLKIVYKAYTYLQNHERNLCVSS